MADTNTTIDAKAAIEAPAKVAETVAATVDTVAKAGARTAKRERTKTARRAARPATAKKTARPARKSRTATAKTRAAVRNTANAANERIQDVTNNFFSGFQAAPAFAPFQSLFAEANERSQEIAKRGQKVAEEMTDLARANVEAIVEAGRVAAAGARSLGQDVLAKSRDGVEQTADAIRTFAEAKSPTEYLQLQSDFARSSFDRVVAETSKLTESWVKLAGEAIQPLSNRAAANAERLNSIVA